jgi:cell division protein FtsZ
MKEELMPFIFGDETDEMSTINNQLGSIIKVIGVGGGGGNAVNTMYEKGIKNVEFVIANTDIQVLDKSPVPIKLQLGKGLTNGLGAGNNPEQGKNAALESTDEIAELFNDGTKMVFITAGMGGGTGTGAAPVIAEIAKGMGILTIGIVTIPFRYEGKKRLNNAVTGLEEMRKNVDAIIVIDNEKIGEVYANKNIKEAFSNADEILTIAAKGIAEIITKEGEINVDFADVKSVMEDSDVAVMGTGYGKGETRGLDAVKNAINSPLLNNNDISGAENLLVNIISPSNEKGMLTIEETGLTNTYLQEKAGNGANLIWGLSFDDELKDDQCAVTVIATKFNDNILPNFSNINIIAKPETNGNDSVDDNDDNGDKDDIKPIDPYILARQRLSKKPKRIFDYTDDDIVDTIHEQPAYVRQKIDLNLFNNNFNDNSFLNPNVD